MINNGKKPPMESQKVQVNLLEDNQKEVSTLKSKVRMLQEENEKMQNSIINDRKKLTKQLEEKESEIKDLRQNKSQQQSAAVDKKKLENLNDRLREMQ